MADRIKAIVRRNESRRWYYICSGCGFISTPCFRWKMTLLNARMHVGHERFREHFRKIVVPTPNLDPWTKAR